MKELVAKLRITISTHRGGLLARQGTLRVIIWTRSLGPWEQVQRLQGKAWPRS
jgi:hypothetical protein